jgi:predicted O-methyltransferase YrrM
VLIWLFVFAAIGLAIAVAGYVMLRLKPALIFLRDSYNKLTAELSLAGVRESDFDETGWRNDERRLSRMLDKQEVASKQMAKELADANAEIGRTKKTVSNIEKELRGGDDASANAPTRLDKLEATLTRHTGANAAKSISHSRLLSEEACRRALEELCPALSLEFTERHLYGLANRVCILESQCHGRLATSVDAMLMRLLAGMHVAQQPGGVFRLVEIGVLYGVGSIALFDAARFYAKDARMTLIDPLEGYYAPGTYDYCSTKPVSRAVLEENLNICRIPMEQVEIIQGKSEAAEVLEAVAGREFDMLIIDGDHSREGVKRDFENYYPKLRQGGLAIIDDYGVKEWPEIKAYADETVLPRADVQLVYKGSRTLLLRKI